MKTSKTAKPKATPSRKPARSESASPGGDPGSPPIRIEVHLGGAREVYLAGSFNDWHETTLPMVDLGRGRWVKELVLPTGEHEYLFIADGRWVPNPGAPKYVPNPFGGVNSVLCVG